MVVRSAGTSTAIRRDTAKADRNTTSTLNRVLA